MGRPRLIAIALVAAVCAGMTLAPATSAAGGGAVFGFDSDYYAPGDHVTGETSVGFGFGRSADLEDGPFSAWLFRSGTDFRRDAAVLLGPIAFEPRGDDLAIARISFTVPDVRPGLYEIATCNRDCSVRWIGDLVGGWFTVVATREEIPLRELEDRLADRIRILQGRLQLFRDRLVDAETEANSAISDAQLAVNNARDLESDVKSLHAELARLAEDRDGPTLSQVAGWVVAGLVGGLAGALVMARRRPSQAVDGPAELPLPTESRDLWRPEGEAELASSGRR